MTETIRREKFEQYVPTAALDLLIGNLEIEEDLGIEEGTTSVSPLGLFSELFPGEDEVGDGGWRHRDQREADARVCLLTARGLLRLADEADRLRERGMTLLSCALRDLAPREDDA